MRFLVTNDDSIECTFLHLLVAALREAGQELIVAAPRTEQSWIGAAKSRSRGVEASAVDRGFGCPTWSIDGTPSDCVNIALAHLVPESWVPDAVLSGINVGFNASLAFILASGTVSGAFEGTLHGLPSVAFSQDMTTETFEHLRKGGKLEGAMLETVKLSARRAAILAQDLAKSTPPKSFLLHNINFPNPCTMETEIRRTVPARVIVPRLFSPAADDGTHRLVFNEGEDLTPPGILTDRRAIAAGHISHSLLDYTRL